MDRDRAAEPLVLVDAEDRPVGEARRDACHAPGGRRHRAFSVYLFDGAGRTLVQRRQATKQLWPGFWSNSCCSHPLVGEEVVDAAERRLREELGLVVRPAPVFRYEYRADFGDAGTEHEVVTVLVARAEPSDVRPNADEVAEVEWLEADALDRAIEDEARFTPWFRIAWPRLRAEHPDALADV